MKDKAIFGITLILIFIAGGLTTLVLGPEIIQTERMERTGLNGEPVQWNRTAKPLPEGVRTYIVGTTEDGEGVVSSAWARAEPGVGKILVDIKSLFFWIDIQNSIRTASSFSRDYLEIERDEHDLTYSMDLNVSIIGGPSAGAALTVATMAALKNSSINDDVVMTGTVEPDGTIGKVGEIVPKAKAVDEKAFDRFLVPEGQSVQMTYTKEESCRTGDIDICRTEYREEKVDVDEQVDVDVIEVENIEEALNYFL